MARERQYANPGRPPVAEAIQARALELLREGKLTPKDISESVGLGLTKVYELRRLIVNGEAPTPGQVSGAS